MMRRHLAALLRSWAYRLDPSVVSIQATDTVDPNGNPLPGHVIILPLQKQVD